MRALAFLLLAVATACAAPPQVDRAAVTPVRLDFPAPQGFAGASPGPATRSNAEMARDFLDLAFEMENGRSLPILTRFEGPITVRVSGPINPISRRDLDRLLARLRNEAGIDIRLTTAQSANIVVQAVPTDALQRLAPNAACFVVPRVQTWAQLRAARGTPTLDWATLDRRDRVAMFIPFDVTPQETRDCLHEELAQALGPINDLYRLPDSVFNDDNIQTILTGFDMLMLRVYYAPELQNGMTRAAVAERLPAILRRLNPAGEGRPAQIVPRTTPLWKAEIERALSDGRPNRVRRVAAQRAIAIAEDQGWTDIRLAFAHYAYGRLQIENDPSRALQAFNTASRIYNAIPDTRIHRAFIAMQLAAYTLISGDADATIAITQAAIPQARRHENAALLSLLMMFQAEALDLKGQTDAGMALRLDSLGYALYGFGSREEVVARLNEIASLPPLAANIQSRVTR
ncbi:DUF2927 domain-containing protein [Yoonia sp.]|uniref:DUF2927 domain-containing protein n=1 Tax=Yoonia sp. TaxID=2212373 RepID=UPI002FD99332